MAHLFQAGNMHSLTVLLEGDKLEVALGLEQRTPQMGWRLLAEPHPKSVRICLRIGGARSEDCDPRSVIENIIHEVCTRGGAEPAQVLVGAEDIFLALVELDTVTVEQIKSATVSEDGKEVLIEGVSFGGFPDGKRDLRLILALYDLDEPQDGGQVDLVTRTSDGVNIL